MSWIMNILLTTAFGYLGWYAGGLMGTGMALFLSLNGMILGWYAARRFMAWLDE